MTVAVTPPQPYPLWRILRKASATFTDQNDVGAVLLSDSNDTFVVDAGADLANGTTYYYTVFYFDSANDDWIQDSVVPGVPASTLKDISVDALSILRDRLAVGLANEVAVGNLIAESGVIKVLTAPPIYEDTKWPVVSVHLQTEASGERALGEVLFPGQQPDESGNYPDGEGWLADTSILVVGWTLNPDVRIALRKALRRIVVGNLPVFDRLGLVEIDFSQTDMDELERYDAPVYQTVGTFTCQAPIAVTAEVSVIAGVDVTITEVDPVLNLTSG